MTQTLHANDQDELTALRRSLADAEARASKAVTERDLALTDLALRDRAINATSSGITIIDVSQPGRPIIYMNDAVAKRMGYETSELLGRDVFSLFQDADPQILQQIKDTIARGEEARVEVRSKRKDGTEYWVGMFLGPIRDAFGWVTHYIGVSADITARLDAERKRKELQDQLAHEMQERERMALELKLSQKLESVGRLAAGIAHEINTPIQYVSDSAHFLRDAVKDLEKLLSVYYQMIHSLSQSGQGAEALAKVRETEAALDLEFMREEMPRAFDRLLDGVERVTKIVRAMKEFAHPDGEEQSPADLNHALETTLMVAHNEYKYVASVTTHFGELPPVKCNVGELNQVFLNIIVNAAHAIASAGREVGLIEISTALAGDHVEITFQDNGCGIAQEHIDKIYDPFFTTKEVGKGTGQGLAISRSIVVDHHGGMIEVNSTVGEGTRFKLRLPVAGRIAENK